MDEYTKSRIRQSSENIPGVVQGSTPVVFFGDIKNSRVATLGLNPSTIEFQDKNGKFLTDKRRLETLESLDASDLSSLSDEQFGRIHKGCVEYFTRNPYRGWFDQLENSVLKHFSVSYYDGTACHLDVVQWATNPLWGELPKPTINKLLEHGLELLRDQLQNENIEKLLINGSGAANEFKKHFNSSITDVYSERLTVDNKTCDLHSFQLELDDGKKIQVYGWSKNLQAQFGPSPAMKEEIGNWLGKRHKENNPSL